MKSNIYLINDRSYTSLTPIADSKTDAESWLGYFKACFQGCAGIRQEKEMIAKFTSKDDGTQFSCVCVSSMFICLVSITEAHEKIERRK